MELEKHELIEKVEEFIELTKNDLFQRYPGLFSISWDQSVEENGAIHLTIDEVQINETEYKSTLTRFQKERLRNEVFWAFESIDPQTFIDIYGENVKVTLTESDFEIDNI